MKSYKCFEKVCIGCSDIASLTLRSVHKVGRLDFIEDSVYSAYECIGDDVEIGAHYHSVFDGQTWLKIYDDHELMYDRHLPEGFQHVTIYRAANHGCIIHWHS